VKHDAREYRRIECARQAETTAGVSWALEAAENSGAVAANYSPGDRDLSRALKTRPSNDGASCVIRAGADAARTLLNGVRNRSEDHVPNMMHPGKRRLEGLVPPTVVIVDSEALYRWFVSESLAAFGVHVVQCRTVGEAASYLAGRGWADLLLVDAQTAADEGDGARGALRRLAASAPSLLLDSSSPGGHESPRDGMDVVEKPDDSGVLVETVNSRLHPGELIA
jgi:CheY-like chemotaxis protein